MFLLDTENAVFSADANFTKKWLFGIPIPSIPNYILDTPYPEYQMEKLCAKLCIKEERGEPLKYM